MLKKVLAFILFLTFSGPAFSQPVFVPDSAELIAYDNPSYVTVDAALDYLLYVAPNITSFTNNHNNVEIGTTITSTVLNWTNNKTMTTESIDNGIGALSPPTLLTYTHTSTYSTNRTYVLTVGDGTSTDNDSTSITFLSKRYWGGFNSTTINDAQIIALDGSELSASRTKTISNLTLSNEYFYYCYPASLGAATFLVNGLSNNDFTLSTQNHTNASGATVSYRVYRTNNLLTGDYTFTVQ